MCEQHRYVVSQRAVLSYSAQSAVVLANHKISSVYTGKTNCYESHYEVLSYLLILWHHKSALACCFYTIYLQHGCSDALLVVLQLVHASF